MDPATNEVMAVATLTPLPTHAEAHPIFAQKRLSFSDSVAESLPLAVIDVPPHGVSVRYTYLSFRGALRAKWALKFGNMCFSLFHSAIALVYDFVQWALPTNPH
jgi:hypothetical protein